MRAAFGTTVDGETTSGCDGPTALAGRGDDRSTKFFFRSGGGGGGGRLIFVGGGILYFFFRLRTGRRHPPTRVLCPLHRPRRRRLTSVARQCALSPLHTHRHRHRRRRRRRRPERFGAASAREKMQIRREFYRRGPTPPPLAIGTRRRQRRQTGRRRAVRARGPCTTRDDKEKPS